MKTFLVPLCLFYSLLIASSHFSSSPKELNENWEQRGKRDTTNTKTASATTKVISIVVEYQNLTSDDDTFKATYQEVKTYALLKRDPKGTLSYNFSMCSALFITRDEYHYPLALLGEDGDLLVRVYIAANNRLLKNTSLIRLSIQNVEYHDEERLISKVFPEQWVRVCMAISMQTGSIKLVINGILVHDIISDVLMKAVEKSPTNLAGKIIIGATRRAEGWEHRNTIITQMNIFSYALSKTAMKARTEHKSGNCEDSGNGNYLSWDEMEWEMHGDITTHFVDNNQSCKNESDIMLYYTEFAKMSDCMHHCEKLGGRAPKVVTQEDWHRLQEFMNNNYYGKVENTMDGLWMSVSDEDKEGEWRDFYSGELMNYNKGPFTGNGPNGGDRENCAIQVSSDSWIDWLCDAIGNGYFCACSHEKRQLLQLRGLCTGSFLETVFIPRRSVGDVRDLHYVGEQGTEISYDEEQKQWSLTKQKVAGHSISSKRSYVLGKHNWTIENDTYECNNGKPYSVQLKLTSCSDGQFTCNSGQCVRMEDRCDQFSDCRDETDEKDCDLLMLREGYNMKIPPHQHRTSNRNKRKYLVLPV